MHHCHSHVCACRYMYLHVHSYTATHKRVISYLTHMLFLILPPRAVMNYDMDVARSIAVFIGGIVVLTFIAERFHRGWRHRFVVLCCCCCCYVSGTWLCGYRLLLSIMRTEEMICVLRLIISLCYIRKLTYCISSLAILLRCYFLLVICFTSVSW